MISFVLASSPTLATAFPLQLAIADALPGDIRLIVFAGLAFSLVITVAGFISSHHKDKLRHETIRLALEKGQPVPPDILEPVPKTTHRPRNDPRSGLILVAIAIGIFVFLFMQREAETAFAACIPAAIALALLFNASYEEKERKKKESLLPKS